jgi:PDZ domain
MTTRLKFRSLAVALFIFQCCSVNADILPKKTSLTSLDMEHFRDTATVKEDPSDSTTTITTEKGYVDHQGLLRTVSNDEYLKGVIDKKTGQKSFQVEAWMTYQGRWRTYQTASYQGSSGPKSVPAIQLSKDLVNCAAGSCMNVERLEFPIDEALLRQLAAVNTPGRPTMWQFKLIGKSGPDYVAGLSSAEIAGFLAKVDDYINPAPAAKASTSAPIIAAPVIPPPRNPAPVIPAPVIPAPVIPAPVKTAPISPPSASAPVSSAVPKQEFGVGAMSVPASADQPNRSGILIIGVNSGSIAQKSGIIVGDIIYEFNGHPVKTAADLQTAVAACPANSTAAISLYRGTNTMVVTAHF